MADVELTQAEADALIRTPKCREDNQTWKHPSGGGSICIPLVSEDKRERFSLDISRKGIDLKKDTHQTRARQSVVLLRLDLGGALHRNPDGEDVPCPHLHIYREGYGDKWAYPVSPNEFTDLEDLSQTLNDFMRYSNIIDPPVVLRGLFP